LGVQRERSLLYVAATRARDEFGSRLRGGTERLATKFSLIRWVLWALKATHSFERPTRAIPGKDSKCGGETSGKRQGGDCVGGRTDRDIGRVWGRIWTGCHQEQFKYPV